MSINKNTLKEFRPIEERKQAKMIVPIAEEVGHENIAWQMLWLDLLKE